MMLASAKLVGDFIVQCDPRLICQSHTHCEQIGAFGDLNAHWWIRRCPFVDVVQEPYTTKDAGAQIEQVIRDYQLAKVVIRVNGPSISSGFNYSEPDQLCDNKPGI